MRKAPPPFSKAVNGNLQTFPRPTDIAMQDKRNSISFPHISRESLPYELGSWSTGGWVDIAMEVCFLKPFFLGSGGPSSSNAGLSWVVMVFFWKKGFLLEVVIMKVLNLNFELEKTLCFITYFCISMKNSFKNLHVTK